MIRFGRHDRSLLARVASSAVPVAAAVIAILLPLPGGGPGGTVSGSSPAAAQSAPGATPASPLSSKEPRAKTASCTPKPGMLGVARTVEIDTASGPYFGQQQYKDNDFLRDGEVVLTFDDGPLRRHTQMVLDALAAHCTRATFFMVGQMALSDPDMVREVARAGHTVGIHTWSHQNLRARGAAKATVEVELGISAVQRALGEPVAPFFRFPYLADSQAMLAHLASRRFGVFSIDVDSLDYRTHDPRQMQRRVIAGLVANKKGIILNHDIQTSTAHGIKGLLDELAARGFKVVHMVPKAKATTQPSFDATAEAEFQRRNKLAAANPLASRSVVWPMSPPNGPGEALKPKGTAAAQPAPPGPPARAGSRTGPVVAQQPLPVVAPPAAPAPQTGATAEKPAAQAEQRPALRGTASDEDWRSKAFGQ